MYHFTLECFPQMRQYLPDPFVSPCGKDIMSIAMSNVWMLFQEKMGNNKKPPKSIIFFVSSWRYQYFKFLRMPWALIITSNSINFLTAGPFSRSFGIVFFPSCFQQSMILRVIMTITDNIKWIFRSFCSWICKNNHAKINKRRIPSMFTMSGKFQPSFWTSSVCPGNCLKSLGKMVISSKNFNSETTKKKLSLKVPSCNLFFFLKSGHHGAIDHWNNSHILKYI